MCMKRFFVFWGVVIFATTIAYSARYDVEVDGVFYKLNAETHEAKVVNGGGYSSSYKGDVVIPESIISSGETYTVTSIEEAYLDRMGGTYGFSWSGITSITLPNTIESIPDFCFYNSSSLTTINWGKNIKTIGSGAFYDCNFSSIQIPEGVESIGQRAFSAESIEIPSSLKEWGSGTSFSASSTIKNVYITDLNSWCDISVVSGEFFGTLWLNNEKVTDLVIPEGIININAEVFSGLECIESVIVPNSVTSIGSNAFYGCKNIRKLTFGNSVSSVSPHAFYGVTNLEEFVCYVEDPQKLSGLWYDFPQNVTIYVPTRFRAVYKSFLDNYSGKILPIDGLYLVNYVVDGKEYKTFEVKEGDTITPEAEPTKEGYTFSGWSEIPEIMPAHDVTVTGTFAINKYKLIYMVDNEVYKSYEIEYNTIITPEAGPTKEGYSFSGWSEIPERMPAKDVTVSGTFTQDVYEEGGNSYTIDENGATIVKGEDKEGEVLINATITINGKTYQVIVIGEGAYKGCSKMSAVVIPDAIKTIGANAFDECRSLRSVNIGKGVMAIDHKAFANMGSGAGVAVTRAGEAGLNFTCTAETVPTADNDVFENTDIANAKLVINDNLVDSYKSTMPWNGFGTIMGFEEATGIDVLSLEPQGTEIYSIDGRRLSKAQRGLNVVRTNEGMKKVVER